MNKYIIHTILSLAFISSALVSCDSTGNKESTINRPNVVFILADDMGYGIPGCYGGSHVATPNIDKLSNQGIKFTQAYSGCSVCAPSRASLFLGRHTGNTSLRGNTGGIPILDSDTTLAEVLKANGYVTGGFGKWGMGDIGTPGVPEMQGFDDFFGYYHQIHAHFFYTDYQWHNSTKVNVLNEQENPDSYTPNLALSKMKDFIVENKDTSFFCYGSWILPHTDDDGNPVIPKNDPSYLQYSENNWPEDVKQFAAMNSRVDRDLGEITELLDRLNLIKNTIVIFSSDNGGGKKYDDHLDVNGNLRGFKHTFYEGGIKVPLLIRFPKMISNNYEVDFPIYFADLLPTIAEMTNSTIGVPNELDGHSFLNNMTSENGHSDEKAMYWELPAYDWRNSRYPENGLQQAVRVGDWKMLRHAKDEKWELYNIAKDASESIDLSKKFPDKINEMEKWIVENRKESIPQVEPTMENGKWYR